MTKKNHFQHALFSLSAASLVVACAVGTSHAQVLHAMTVVSASGAQPYVVDSQRDIVKDGAGQCVRSGTWSADDAAGVALMNQPLPAGCYCDEALMPQGACTVLVAAAPVMPAPAPAPVAPAPAPAMPQAEKVTIPADTLFAFDQHTLSDQGRTALNALLQKLQRVDLEAIVAVGYTDRIGSASYNQTLSERRAESVKTYLIEQGGIKADRIFIEGRGEAQPATGDACQKLGAATRHNQDLKACLAPDRRVVIEAVGTMAR